MPALRTPGRAPWTLLAVCAAWAPAVRARSISFMALLHSSSAVKRCGKRGAGCQSHSGSNPNTPDMPCRWQYGPACHPGWKPAAQLPSLLICNGRHFFPYQDGGGRVVLSDGTACTGIPAIRAFRLQMAVIFSMMGGGHALGPRCKVDISLGQHCQAHGPVYITAVYHSRRSVNRIMSMLQGCQSPLRYLCKFLQNYPGQKFLFNITSRATSIFKLIAVMLFHVYWTQPRQLVTGQTRHSSSTVMPQEISDNTPGLQSQALSTADTLHARSSPMISCQVL